MLSLLLSPTYLLLYFIILSIPLSSLSKGTLGTVSEVGNWGNYDIITILTIVSFLIGWLYSLKFDEIIVLPVELYAKRKEPQGLFSFLFVFMLRQMVQLIQDHILKMTNLIIEMVHCGLQ